MILAKLLFAAVAVVGTQASFIDQLKGLLQSDPVRAESFLRTKFKADDLKQGIPPYKQGTTVLFAIDPGPGNHKATVSGDNLPETTLTPVGTLLIDVVELKSGQGTSVTYHVDGKATAKTYNLEVYTPNPVVEAPPGGRKGELRDMGEWKSTIFPNTIRKWYVYLPPNFQPDHEYPVLIGDRKSVV